MIIDTNKPRYRKRKKHRKRKNGCIVYGLFDTAGVIQYVGQTRLSTAERLKWYYKAINRKISRKQKLTPVEKWVSHLMMFNIKPEIRIIDENAIWDVSEVIYLDRYRQSGFKLLNCNLGGRDSSNKIIAQNENNLLTQQKH